MNNKIRPSQMVILLLGSRIITTLTFSLGGKTTEFINSYWAASLISIPVVAVLFLPVYFCYRVSGVSLVDSAYKLGKPVGHIAGVIYSLYALLIALSTILRFNTFVLANTNFEITPIFLVILIIPLCYTACKGLEPISRFAFPAIISGLSVIAFIMLLLLPRIDHTNITMPFYSGIKVMFTDVYYSVTNYIEIALFGLLCGSVKRPTYKTVAVFVLISCVIVALIVFIMSTVLGPYAYVQIVSFYSLASIAESGIIRRMDAIQTAVWLIFAYIKSSLCIYLAYECLKRIFKNKFRTIVIIVLSGIIFVAAMMLNKSYYIQNTVYQSDVRGIINLVLSVALPLILLIPLAIKKKKGSLRGEA